MRLDRHKGNPVKEYLKQLWDIEAELKSLAFAIEEQEALATRTTTSLNPDRIGIMLHSGNATESAFIKMADALTLLNNKIVELMDLKNYIIWHIYLIEDKEQRTLLISYYINRKSFEQISCDLNRCYRSTLYLHGAALQSFEKICPVLKCLHTNAH